MGRECASTPDWTALAAREAVTQHSITPSSFFGCEPVEPAPAGFDLGPQPTGPADLLGLSHWADAGPVAAPAPTPAAPRVGLDAYDVVPDDFVGPLQANQIRASQRATLDKFDFGGLNVVGDDFVGPLQRGQMRQADYASLQSSWLNISSGTGMQMTGSAADQDQFMHMMRADIGASNTFQQTIRDIGNDTDPAHRVSVDLGHGQDITGAPGTGVWGDSFGTNQVDLDDFNFFPVTPDAARPDELTQTELMTHFLTERRSAALSADPTDFGPAHAAGIATQNRVRDELGQSHVLSQTGAANAAGGTDGVFSFANGTTQTVRTDAHNNMIRPPVAPAAH